MNFLRKRIEAKTQPEFSALPGKKKKRKEKRHGLKAQFEHKNRIWAKVFGLKIYRATMTRLDNFPARTKMFLK